MKTSKTGVQFWMARDLQTLLGYDEWRNFETAIERAIESCASGGIKPEHHFVGINKMVGIGSGATRERADWFLTRYACYLIAMNGDARKPEIGYAQQYFAVQTRLQELDEESRRLDHRMRLVEANKELSSAAKNAGVQRYAVFNDAGYRGLYDGLSLQDIKKLKGISTKENFLDCICSEELADNLFRASQTRAKLLRENIAGEGHAIETHRRVAQEVRGTIARLGGTMPEKLPRQPAIKRLTAKRKKQIPPPL